LGEEAPYETSKEGKEIFIDVKEKAKKIEAKAEAPPPEVKKEAPPAEVKKEEIKKEEEVKKEEKPAPEVKKEEMKAEQKPAPSIQAEKKAEEEKKIVEERPSQKVYSGRKLSLDFKDADIKNILRLIAEVSNLNIIAGDEVTGKITMRLVDVPWDQALEVILQSKNLGMSRIGNVVRIAPLEALKREIQAELEAKRAKERLEDLVMELIPVNYAAAKEIMPQVKSILSDRGDIKVDERTNTLIIKDIAKSIPGAKSLVKALDTKTPMVLIEARIIEANLSFQRELGVRWGFLIGGGKATAGGGTTGTSTLTTPATTTHNAVDLPAIARTAVPGATATSGIIEAIFSRGTLKSLDIAISAHENIGDVKIISSPKIATLDNKEASVEQGLRIPYLKLTTEGTVTTDFIDANLKLTVTPHVTNDGTIKMVLKVKKDAPDTSISVEGVPSIDKKEAISEVLVKDNGVVVIAGVYSIEKDSGDEGIPLFKKIPLLGWLFKRETKDDKRKDLLIFISPKILKDEI
jgi:type IV pilus assembly protein PilQ